MATMFLLRDVRGCDRNPRRMLNTASSIAPNALGDQLVAYASLRHKYRGEKAVQDTSIQNPCYKAPNRHCQNTKFENDP